ncbi:MAG TPA: alpha/beta hydrolase [Rhizomicrobium sp.]|jgi:lysophospholipase|nr:alpha/beta hydrolase [Rhizomicrobium sp.]HEX4532960.1 alpha/beta hydrolase [Rhizomicrobium sp.]
MTCLDSFKPEFIDTPDGARLRTAVWDASSSAPSRGLCILLNGQTEFIEKYCEVIDELRGRGFAVATFDWRGQGGSSRALADPLTCHIEDFKQYDTDLATFMEKIVKPLSPKPPLALAHSMGANILLRALHANSAMCSGAVMTAPMLGISTRGQPAWLVSAITTLFNALGKSQGYVFGMSKRDALNVTFDQNLVSQDRLRWERAKNLLRQNPKLRVNGPTWGWLKAAYGTMREVNAPGYAQAITTPALIFGAQDDRIVQTSAVFDFARHMPNATYIEIPGAEHEILMDRDGVRERFWKAFDAFVEKLG